ncbi:hypothetical protein ACDZ28_00265 (plasmid) [Paenibacillus sp. RS8]|uniref:hypothetical protein n=1 Tax=Paenibacillus sp. RS8 TaxID=3242681 RepID=UPI0035BFB97D
MQTAFKLSRNESSYAVIRIVKVRLDLIPSTLVPCIQISKAGATHFGQQPAIWSYFAGILPMARIANIFHTPILPVVAEVLIYLLYATVG